ncbi:helix-turn-helix domain-containing protein [Streptococcus pluranimalium]|uniref:helix-turn-helix domain-containing protein n=1 Tax=Streptococcus pluranimalium TaxID=82348 RepID=UPI001F2A9461|nr:helix-turn-helix transcriptional regulator [Streptococcus pluranimalium]
MILDKETILAITLKKYRQDNGLTQAELAEQLDVSDKTISKWENGETYPSKRNMMRLSDQLGVSIESLLIESSQKESRGLRVGNYTIDYIYLIVMVPFIIMAIKTQNYVFFSSVIVLFIIGAKKQ